MHAFCNGSECLGHISKNLHLFCTGTRNAISEKQPTTNNTIKAITMTCLLALSTCAFAGDLLSEIQGKWKVDIQATKATPEAKQMLSATDDLSKAMFKGMFGALEITTYEFSKVSITMHANHKPEKGRIDLEVNPVKTFEIIKSTDKELVVKTKEAGETFYIYKQGKGFVMRDAEQGKPANDAPSIVLIR